MSSWIITSEFLEASGYLFEKKNNQLADNEEHLISKFFNQSMDLNEVKETIIDSIEKNDLPLDLKSNAFWALGKLFDRELRNFFIKHLKKELNDPDAAYQIMIALENLGEDIFPQDKTRNVAETEKNLGYAQKYLEREGMSFLNLIKS